MILRGGAAMRGFPFSSRLTEQLAGLLTPPSTAHQDCYEKKRIR
jgi:hypothetical protein